MWLTIISNTPLPQQYCEGQALKNNVVILYSFRYREDYNYYWRAKVRSQPSYIIDNTWVRINT